MDLNLELSFTLSQRKIRRQKAKKIKDADYTDDLEMLTDCLRDETSLLHGIHML